MAVTLPNDQLYVGRIGFNLNCSCFRREISLLCGDKNIKTFKVNVHMSRANSLFCHDSNVK